MTDVKTFDSREELIWLSVSEVHENTKQYPQIALLRLLRWSKHIVTDSTEIGIVFKRNHQTQKYKMLYYKNNPTCPQARKETLIARNRSSE